MIYLNLGLSPVYTYLPSLYRNSQQLSAQQSYIFSLALVVPLHRYCINKRDNTSLLKLIGLYQMDYSGAINHCQVDLFSIVLSEHQQS